MTKELNAAVAKRRIAKFHTGADLDLSGFTAITEDAAKLLAALEGSVDLLHVEEISDAIAEIFSQHKGTLSLDALKSLSVAAAASLARHDGWLYLGLREISDDAALALSKGIGSLKLCELERLDGSPGHIALARKLAANRTVYALYNLTIISKELLAAVPEFNHKSNDNAE